MSYQVVIVDDEQPARDLLKSYVAKLAELELVAAESNVLDAKRTIENEQVDILLTDIEMEDLTGIDLMKILKDAPVTIFTTAFSEYALEGFELDIVDYLVKPISFQRFCKSIDKAKELLEYRHSALESGMANPVSKEAVGTDYFFVKTNRKMVKVRYDDILYLESFGEYVKLFTVNDTLLALQTTNYMEQILPENQFIRIHRSHIVNLDHIKEVEGNQVIIDNNGLNISKRMRE
ncbi:MAG: LytTR family DNA-binding domain-containing protein, partial [Bacteroidota bacterium]